MVPISLWSGLPFSLVHQEDAARSIVAALHTRHHGPVNIVGPGVMFAKMMGLVTVIMWVRFSSPRFREDQLQTFAWKFLIPLSLANIAVTAILKVAI